MRTERLTLREMGYGDLDHMAQLLGDPVVMRYYPRPKSRDEARRWIAWNLRNYRKHGYGLWLVSTAAGEFVGDCGLTWQDVEGEQRLEIGYHLLPQHHGQGYATEAARACVDYAFTTLAAPEVVAIIRTDNGSSQAVAERLGMTVARRFTKPSGECDVLYRVANPSAGV